MAATAVKTAAAAARTAKACMMTVFLCDEDSTWNVLTERLMIGKIDQRKCQKDRIKER